MRPGIPVGIPGRLTSQGKNLLAICPTPRVINHSPPMIGKNHRPISILKVPVSYPRVGVFVQYAGSSPQASLGSAAARVVIS